MPNNERDFILRRSPYWIVKLSERTIPPLDVGRMIGPNLLLYLHEEALELPDDVVESAYNNTIIEFPLDPIGGAAVVANDDNWGVTPLGYDVQRFWDLGARGQGVRLGIADSGMDATHPSFATLLANQRLVSFAGFSIEGIQEIQNRPDGSLVLDSEAQPTFSHPHGTVCGAILVGEPTEGKLRGVAPDAELAVAKVLFEGKTGSVASINSGLLWLAEQNCDIISLSLGWPGKHEEWADAIENLLRQGTVVVAAVGNEFGAVGVGQSRSPANYPIDTSSNNVGLLISVGALAQNGSIWVASGGENVDWSGVTVELANGTTIPSKFVNAAQFIVPTVVAPGVGIISAMPSNLYGDNTGTSMATPHLAGLIALVLSKLRSTNAQAKPRDAALLVLQSLVDILPAGIDIRSGRGKVDIDLLLSLLSP